MQVSCVEPNWNAKTINKKKGSTTLKTCGWCEYATGTYRYGCMLEGNCTLMKEYAWNKGVTWDTECKLKSLGKKDISSIINSKNYKIADYKSNIKGKKIEIYILKSLAIKARDIPALPESREVNHFKLGSIVYVYHDPTNSWKRGVVVNGYRSGDGCVSFVLDNVPESNGEGGPWGCGIAVPGVLLELEYIYFKKHKKEFKKWLKNSDKSYNGKKLNLDKYFEVFYNSK